MLYADQVETCLVSSVRPGAWLGLALSSPGQHDADVRRQETVSSPEVLTVDVSIVQRPAEEISHLAEVLTSPDDDDVLGTISSVELGSNLTSYATGPLVIDVVRPKGNVSVSAEVDDCDLRHEEVNVEEVSAMWMNGLREPEISLHSRRALSTLSGGVRAPVTRHSAAPTQGHAQVPFFERCMSKKLRREEQLMCQRRLQEEEKLRGCTFRPCTLTHRSPCGGAAVRSDSPMSSRVGAQRAVDLFKSHAGLLAKREKQAAAAADREVASFSFAPVVNRAKPVARDDRGDSPARAADSSFSRRISERRDDHFEAWESAKAIRLEELRAQQRLRDLAALRAVPKICDRSDILVAARQRGAQPEDVADRLLQAGKEQAWRAASERQAAEQSARVASVVSRHTEAHRQRRTSSPHRVSPSREAVLPVHERLFRHDSPLRSSRHGVEVFAGPTTEPEHTPTLCPRSVVLVGGAIQRSRTPVHDRLIAEGRAVVARRERQREAVRNAKPDQEGDSLST